MMNSFDDHGTLGARITETSEELRNISDSQQKWLDHLDASIEAFNDDLRTRIQEIRERHRRAKQDISNDLHALMQELGSLPPPKYTSPAPQNGGARQNGLAAASISGIAYTSAHAKAEGQD